MTTFAAKKKAMTQTVQDKVAGAIQKIMNNNVSYNPVRTRFPRTEIGEFLVGICGRNSRVQLTKSLSDPYTPIHVGTSGTVQFIDDAGHIHVKWDSGQTLALIPGVDQFKVFR